MDYSEDLFSDQLDWYTDASGVIGAGGIHGEKWFKIQWDQQFIADYSSSIEFLELYALMAGVLLWLKNYPNRNISIYTDNQSIMHMVNDSTSGCKHCMILIRMIVLECMLWNVKLSCLHVQSQKNNFADALSRNEMPWFYEDMVEAGRVFDAQPEEFLKQLWPMSKVWSTY